MERSTMLLRAVFTIYFYGHWSWNSHGFHRIFHPKTLQLCQRCQLDPRGITSTARIPQNHLLQQPGLKSEPGYSRVLTQRKNGTEIITGRRTTHISYIYTHDNKCTYIYIIWLFNIYIYWTVPPYTNSHHNPDHKKKHKHDGPKMPLRSWIGTFCQSTNSQRSCGFHSMNPIVHKEVGFVYTLTGKGQWELRSVYWKIQGNPVQRLRLCTILSNQRRPTK